MSPHGTDTARYRVARSDDIPHRGAILTRAGELEIGVFRVGDRLYAYENRCAHQGGPVCRGDVVGRFEEPLGEGGISLGLVESDERIDIACPWHGWEYDLTTGRHIGDPSFSLRSVAVYEADGEVYLEIPRE